MTGIQVMLNIAFLVILLSHRVRLYDLERRTDILIGVKQ